ncbi:MAG: cupin domain-containing protein [Actinomycetales bacterium]|nr:cupin domain-containing protein [Actinomycetales bacterium]
MSEQPRFDSVRHGGAEDFPATRVDRGGFGYAKRVVVAKPGNQLQVAFLEIPPGRSAYPYHWHEGVTEVYVILSGRGRVRSAEGEFEVGPGEVVAFPPGPAGAHRMTNLSASEPLRYVDLDSTADPDVYHYPDSGKTGWASSSAGREAFFRDDEAVDYYDGEPDAG